MIVYWDSCVLLAWAKGEARADVTPEYLAYWVQKFDDGTYKLITSSLLTLEALEARTPEQAWRRIKSYLRPPRADRARTRAAASRLSARPGWPCRSDREGAGRGIR